MASKYFTHLTDKTSQDHQQDISNQMTELTKITRKGLYKFSLVFRDRSENVAVEAFTWNQAVGVIDANFAGYRNLELQSWYLQKEGA